MGKKYRDIKEWRRNAKLRLLEAFGGKCGICGIVDDPCIYDLHHLDSTQKDFAVSGRIKAWSKIVEEAKKCCLLCCVCHRKFHKGLIEIPVDVHRFEEELVTLDPRTNAALKRRSLQLALRRTCPRCSGPKNKDATACFSCSFGKPRIEWASLDLAQLLKDHSNVVTRLAYTLGVSDNGLKKQLVKRGLR